MVISTACCQRTGPRGSSSRLLLLVFLLEPSLPTDRETGRHPSSERLRPDQVFHSINLNPINVQDSAPTFG
jgi:hypothetical protein